MSRSLLWLIALLSAAVASQPAAAQDASGRKKAMIG